MMVTQQPSAEILRAIDQLLAQALDLALSGDESLLAALITETQDAAARRLSELR